MKTTITFDLDREDYDAATHILQWSDARLAMIDFADWLRQQIKYGENETIPLEEVRGQFFSALASFGIDLDA